MKPLDLSRKLIKNGEGNYSISLYDDEFLENKVYKEEAKKLAMRFENMKDPQYSLLMFHSLQNANFTNNRLRDAVEFVINNHEYPTIFPAHIIKFDKVLELKTNLQIRELSQTFGNSIWQHYDTVDVNGTCMYVEKGKMKQFGIFLPEWKSKPHKPVPAPTPEQVDKLAEKFSFTETAEKMAYKPKKSKYQGMKLSADEIVKAAKERAEQKKQEEDENTPL